MKGSRLYWTLLIAFLVIFFILENLSPHKFSWIPTYDKNDKEPFGSYVFDDVVSSSINDYSVVNKTFYQVFKEDSTLTGHAFLITENKLPFVDVDIEYLYKLIHQGNQVMICADRLPYYLEDTLNIRIEYRDYYPPLSRLTYETTKRDSIFFETDTLNAEHFFEVYTQMHPVYIIAGRNKQVYDSDSTNNTDLSESNGTSTKLEFTPANCDSMEVLVWDDNIRPLVIRTFIGKGELFIVSTPLMFTNYGMLDKKNASYIFRLLSYMKDKPLMRIEAYGSHEGNKETPLRYILSEPPLRWAIYFSLLLLLSFMFFAAKRRQRVIPIVNTPPNRNIEFMQLISNLYYQKHNNVEILKMKYTFFCAEVKNFTGIDLQENNPDESDYRQLMKKTGSDIDFLRDLFKNMKISMYNEDVLDIELKQYIDGMNKILRKLKTY